MSDALTADGRVVQIRPVRGDDGSALERLYQGAAGHPVGLLTGAELIAVLCGDPQTPKGGEHHVVNP